MLKLEDGKMCTPLPSFCTESSIEEYVLLIEKVHRHVQSCLPAILPSLDIRLILVTCAFMSNIGIVGKIHMLPPLTQPIP